MMIFSLSTILLGATFSAALPLNKLESRAVQALNQEATAEAHKRDNTATRALTATEIKTSDGRCLFVDPLSGDFRANLTPIQIAACDGSAAQKWDFITKGVHNDRPGTTLVVSSLTNACMNLDTRRAAGNQVLLFSCGGRADGSGQVQPAQLFNFTPGSTSITLAPLNPGGLCFTVRGNVIDQAACGAGASQTFTIGGAAPSAPNSSAVASNSVAPSAASSEAAAPTDCAAPSVSTVIQTVTVTAGNGAGSNPSSELVVPSSAPALVSPSSAPAAPVVTAPSANPTTPVPVRGAGGTLNPAAAAQAHQFDATATRPLTKFQIKSSDGNCLFIDPVAGDFRQNLIPVTSTPCNGSPNQDFDLITEGKHNTGQTGQALIVSSLTNGCLNFDSRRAAGDRVILFSCGGRADGDGQTQAAQLFAFTGNNGARTLTPKNSANTCFVVRNGRLDQANCVAGAAEQQFTFVAGAGAGTPPPATSAAVSSSAPELPSITASSATSTAATAQPTVTNAPANIPAANPTTPVPVSRAGGTLNPEAALEAHTRDNTATRAFSNISLRSADGRCLSIDPTAGDFRQNLIPIAVKTCDNSPNQKFDIVTAGKHNNVPGTALVVSALMQGCVNFDSRRAAGDTTIIFSCGGRAAGEGQTTDSQLFTFTGGNTIVLKPKNSQTVCLAPRGGLLDSTNCTGDASQTFTIV